MVEMVWQCPECGQLAVERIILDNGTQQFKCDNCGWKTATIKDVERVVIGCPPPEIIRKKPCPICRGLKRITTLPPSGLLAGGLGDARLVVSPLFPSTMTMDCPTCRGTGEIETEELS